MPPGRLPPSGSGWHPKDQRVALATAAAQSRGTDTSTSALQLVRQRERKAGTAHADGVAQRDRAAVGVHLVVREPERLRRNNADSRKRLVDLDQVEVSDGQA